MSATAEHSAALVVSREEAADHLGVSLQTFKRHVQPQLHTVKIGRRILVPVASLEAFLAEDLAA
jgi:predicted protein tyrosine phosphatase